MATNLENEMTNTEARAYFDAAIALTTDPDAIAKLELCREYFTNEEFRAALQDHIYLVNTGAA